jgi:hypothetical protein
MRLYHWGLLLALAGAAGCAASQPVRLQLPPGARIGILNALEPQMTHTAVGSLRFNSFSQVHSVDWDIPNHINRAIEKGLRGQRGQSFVSLSVNGPADWRQSMPGDVLSAVNGWMPRRLNAVLESTAEENRLDAIVTVSSYDSGAWPDAACFKIGKEAVAMKGYGLFTRDRVLSGLSGLAPVGQDTATPYANILVAVFQARPAALAGYGRAPCSEASLTDFPGASEQRMLDPAVIRQVQPHVERLGAEAAQSALRASGLLP